MKCIRLPLRHVSKLSLAASSLKSIDTRQGGSMKAPDYIVGHGI
jgi:hypothetical protein